MVDRLPVLTLLVIPDQDPAPVQVQPRPEEAGVGDLEAGPGARGWADQAGVGGWGEQLLCPHPGLRDCLRVHVVSVSPLSLAHHLTAHCSLSHHSSLASHLCSVSLYLQHHNLIELSCGYSNSFSASLQYKPAW